MSFEVVIHLLLVALFTSQGVYYVGWRHHLAARAKLGTALRLPPSGFAVFGVLLLVTGALNLVVAIFR